MAVITSVVANGSDTAFHIHGDGFGGTQATWSGVVTVSNSGGARSGAAITSWSNTDIYGTLPSDKKLPSGKVYVQVSVRDFNGTYHPILSNGADYTIS